MDALASIASKCHEAEVALHPPRNIAPTSNVVQTTTRMIKDETPLRSKLPHNQNLTTFFPTLKPTAKKLSKPTQLSVAVNYIMDARVVYLRDNETVGPMLTLMHPEDVCKIFSIFRGDSSPAWSDLAGRKRESFADGYKRDPVNCRRQKSLK